MTEVLKTARDQFFFELTATCQLPSQLAEDLKVAKDKKDAAKRRYIRENIRMLSEAGKRREAEVKRRAERRAELDRTPEEKKKARESKSSGDSWQDREEDLWLALF